MTISRKKEREILREKYVESVISYFSVDEDVLRVKSNEIAFPVVGDEGNEDFIVITVKVPTGANILSSSTGTRLRRTAPRIWLSTTVSARYFPTSRFKKI